MGRFLPLVANFWASVIGKSVNSKFRKPAADQIASGEPEPSADAPKSMPHLSRRRVIEYIGYFRYNFFGPPQSVSEKHSEEIIWFNSSQSTHQTPSYISYGFLGRRIEEIPLFQGVCCGGSRLKRFMSIPYGSWKESKYGSQLRG